MFKFKKIPETISGLPSANWETPQGFTIIWSAEEAVFHPFYLLSNYCMYKAAKTLETFGATINIIRTVLVSTPDNQPLMYAFAVDDGDAYILAQIGFSDIYKVAKTDVIVKDTKFYRVIFSAPEGKRHAILIVDAGKKHKIRSIVIRYPNGIEIPSDKWFLTNQKALKWLEKNGF